MPRQHALGTLSVTTVTQSSNPTTRIISRHLPPVCHAMHVSRPGALACPHGSYPRSLQGTIHCALRFTALRHTSSHLPEMDCLRDDSTIFEDVFCLCDFALLGYRWPFTGEDTKTNPCWQCDHTERASPGTTSATLITAYCGNFDITEFMTIRRIMGTEDKGVLVSGSRDLTHSDMPLGANRQICGRIGTHLELVSKFCTCPVPLQVSQMGFGTVTQQLKTRQSFFGHGQTPGE